MRLILQLFLICLIAVGVGLGLTWFAVRYPPSLNVIVAGPWKAITNEGAPEVDTYALAALAHRGEVPISIADGLTFRAYADSDGNALSGSCTYLLSGSIPPVRVWSLAVFDDKGSRLPNLAQRFGFTSVSAIRDSAGAVQISLSPQATSGDWIPIISDRAFVVILRLYDTTAAAISGGRSAPELPEIKMVRCGS